MLVPYLSPLTLRWKNSLKEKTIFKSYSESQFLHIPAEKVHGVIRKKYQIGFDFVSFYLHMNFSTLKLRCSLSLRNDCEPGPRYHIMLSYPLSDE